MPQINFTDAFAEDNVAAAPPSAEGQCPTASPALGAPSRLQTTGLARSEWANILFTGIAIAGGLFCAFHFFNGSALLRTALFWPGEVLYPRPVVTSSHIDLASNAPAETALPGSSLEGPSSKTDRSGDPFSRTHKLISLDRPLRSLGRGRGLTAGTPPPLLPPPVFESPVPPGTPAVSGTPGLPGGSVGGLPGPGTLVSQLALLVPGGDALTHSLRTGASTVKGKLVVNMRHDVMRAHGISRRMIERVVVRPLIAVANRRANRGNRGRNANRRLVGTGGQAPQKISSGFGAGHGAPERMNSGSSAVSIAASSGAPSGRMDSAVSGVGGGLRGKVGGIRGAAGKVGGSRAGGGRR